MKDSFTAFLDASYNITGNKCSGELVIRQDFINPLGIVHGGVLFAFGDESAGFLAMEVCGHKAVTADANFHYLSPCDGYDKIRSEARIIKRGKRILVIGVDVKGGDKLLCAGIYTYMIVD